MSITTTASFVLGSAGAATSAMIGLPQAVRALRVSTAGVSSTTFQLAFGVAVAWASYGVAEGLALLVVGNAVLAVSSLLVMFALIRDGQRLWHGVRVALLLSVVCVAVGLVNGTWLGWLGAATSVALRLPQLRTLRSADRVDGVSLHTWVMSTATNVCWFGYAVLNVDPRLLVSTTVNTCTSSSLVFHVLRRRREIAAADGLAAASSESA